MCRSFGLGRVAAFHHGERIGDRVVRALGEHAGDGDLGGDGGVGGVDHAGRCLPAFHQQQAGADVRGGGQVRLQPVPQAKPGEGLLGVEPDRDMRRIADALRAIS